VATIRLIYVEKSPPIRINVECDPGNVEKVRDELAKSARRLAKSVLPDDEPPSLTAVKGGKA
jgi:hypothetical protein